MNRHLRLKAVCLFLVFTIFAAVGVYPILAARYSISSPGWLMDKQLKLGLDLKGGVHLVLRVQTDDALRLVTEQESERLREELKSKNINASNIVVPDYAHFRGEGVTPAPDGAVRTAAH